MMIDIHSHILPGLDDGAKDMETAIEMARIAVKDGIKKMITTPHLFRGGISCDDLDHVSRQRMAFQEALEENNIDLEVFPGAEVHVSHNLIDEIKSQRDCLVLNHSAYMFVEFPSDHVFSGVKDLFFELMTEGIVPIIAHPERNSVFRRNPLLLYELIQMGGFSQANSGSFSGLYGTRAQESVYNFLDFDFIHFLATDCHSKRSSAPQLSEAVRLVKERTGSEEKAKALVDDNPLAVINDQDLPYIPEPKNPIERQKSLKVRLPSFFRRNKG